MAKNTKIIGLTGNIGAGKTVIAGIMESQFHIPVIKADDVAQQVVLEGHLRQDIEQILGKDIHLPDDEKKLCWDRIRAATFTSKDVETAFRSFLHDHVWGAVRQKVDRLPDHPYICVENALLYEVGWDKYCSMVLCVWCEETDAIYRLTKYRKYTAEEALTRLRLQMPVAQKIQLSHMSINTSVVSLPLLGGIVRSIIDRIEHPM